MRDLKKEIEKEKSELSVKLEKIRKLMSSEEFLKMDNVQMSLLNVQVKSMETYSQCLLERIVRL